MPFGPRLLTLSLAVVAARAEPLQTPPDLAADLLLSDPQIAQPVHLSFDERGRLWVVEYRQYPEPAGLEAVERDDYWRVRYDRMPPPPPHAPDSPFRGKDRISIHEDTDRDGTFDAHKVFIDGLNICTSLAFDATGVWVLNPPYLLHYPDEDGDDTPDTNPVVHLEGFGIEDTHSNANSLRWGPDGWLYGCNGSTVSLDVTCPLAEPPAPAVKRSGQCIWRYHPPTHRFEIFAEGGGNSFGIEIDAAGNLFSGHNGGDTRGFHFVPGGYYRKNFGKHGDLSNPFAYGFFPAMIHHKVPRFSHHFLIYEADHLPDRYRGKLLALDILHNNIVLAEISRFGSTFKTKDLERPIQGSTTFRPQHIITGPDGALYVADWGDTQVNHFRNHEGQIDKRSGRVYRIRSAGPLPESKPVAADPVSLLFELTSPNRARRQTALRLVRETRPLAIEAPLQRRLKGSPNRKGVLDGLWALHALGRLTPEMLVETSESEFPEVARWSVRLMRESGWLGRRDVRDLLFGLARTSDDAALLAEVLCAGRAMAPADALELARLFVVQKKLDDDPHLPLLAWWLIEHATRESPEALVAWCDNRQLWSAILFRDILLERITRRLIEAGDKASLVACGELLDRGLDDWSVKQMLEGIAAGLEGVTDPQFPPTLLGALEREKVLLTPALQLRLRFEGSIERAFHHLRRTPEQSAHLLDILAEIHPPEARDPLLEFTFAEETDSRLLPRAIRGLKGFTGERIARELTDRLSTLSPEAREAAGQTLASRLPWSRFTLREIDEGRVDPAHLPASAATRMKLHRDEALLELIAKHFPEVGRQSAADDADFRRLRTLVSIGARGNLDRGKALYKARCGACHQLYDQGRDLGPDLTSYQRDDLDALLLALTAPGAEIREGFEMAIVSLEDESILTGLLRRQDPKSIELLDPAGTRRTIPRGDITSLEISPDSLMPPGLLDGLSDNELRDLFAFLTQIR